MIGACVATGVCAGSLAWYTAAVGLDPARQRLKRMAKAAETPVTAPSPWRLPRRWKLYLEQAGADWSSGQAVAIVAGASAVAYGVGVAAGIGPASTVLGPVAVGLRLRAGRRKRLARLGEQLPHALMLIIGALRSGLGFQQATQFVAKEGPEPIASEFERFARELSMGAPLADALARLQARFASVDAEMLSAAVLIQAQTGGNMSEILTNLHDTIRDRQAVLGQIRTLTAYGRLSGMVLGALPFVVSAGLWFLNREYALVLVNDPRGQVMLAGCAVGMVGAFFSIRRIIAIRY